MAEEVAYTEWLKIVAQRLECDEIPIADVKGSVLSSAQPFLFLFFFLSMFFSFLFTVIFFLFLFLLSLVVPSLPLGGKPALEEEDW